MSISKAMTTIFSGVGILILILDGKTALTGAASGVDLCIKVVIPSLFPFLLLCSVMTYTLWGSSLKCIRPLCRKLQIPQGAESILIPAFLGGYPSGAQTIGQAFREKKLTKDQAHHLLTFCSNAGPAFLFGMTALQFPDTKQIWTLWVIQILSAFLTGILDRKFDTTDVYLSKKESSISDSLSATVKIIAVLCGWIILFRMLIEYLNRWVLWYFPVPVQVLLAGFLELTNGCCKLGIIEDLSLRFIVCTCLLSFGGLCVIMQTASVLGKLSILPYLRGKLIHTIISCLLAVSYLRLGWYIFLLPVFLLIHPLHAKKKWILERNRCIISLSNSGGN